MSRRHVAVAIGPGHYVKQSGVNTGAFDAASKTSEYDLNSRFAGALKEAFINADFIARITPRTRIFPRLETVKDWMDEYFTETGKSPVILYFSLHQNSWETGRANGAEVFVSSPRSKSYPMARTVLDAIIEVSGLRDRGVKSYPWMMLTGDAWRNAGVDVDMIYACLIEFGFITSSVDRAAIKNPSVQGEICRRIVGNVNRWLKDTPIGLTGG